jgi:hypothetical protein
MPKAGRQSFEELDHLAAPKSFADNTTYASGILTIRYHVQRPFLSENELR